MSEKFTPLASAFRPNMTPQTISAINAMVFASVKVSCTSFPSSIPRVFMYVRRRTERTATHCAAVMWNDPRQEQHMRFTGAGTEVPP